MGKGHPSPDADASPWRTRLGDRRHGFGEHASACGDGRKPHSSPWKLDAGGSRDSREEWALPSRLLKHRLAWPPLMTASGTGLSPESS